MRHGYSGKRILFTGGRGYVAAGVYNLSDERRIPPDDLSIGYDWRTGEQKKAV